MNKELFEKLKKSPYMDELYEKLSKLPEIDLDKDVEFVLGWLKARLVEDILIKMNDEKITKTDLAKRLCKNKAYVSRVLNETSNFTLRTIAEIAVALNAKPTVRILDEELSNETQENNKNIYRLSFKTNQKENYNNFVFEDCFEISISDDLELKVS